MGTYSLPEGGVVDVADAVPGGLLLDDHRDPAVQRVWQPSVQVVLDLVVEPAHVVAENAVAVGEVDRRLHLVHLPCARLVVVQGIDELGLGDAVR